MKTKTLLIFLLCLALAGMVSAQPATPQPTPSVQAASTIRNLYCATGEDRLVFAQTNSDGMQTISFACFDQLGSVRNSGDLYWVQGNESVTQIIPVGPNGLYTYTQYGGLFVHYDWTDGTAYETQWRIVAGAVLSQPDAAKEGSNVLYATLPFQKQAQKLFLYSDDSYQSFRPTVSEIHPQQLGCISYARLSPSGDLVCLVIGENGFFVRKFRNDLFGGLQWSRPTDFLTDGSAAAIVSAGGGLFVLTRDVFGGAPSYVKLGTLLAVNFDGQGNPQFRAAPLALDVQGSYNAFSYNVLAGSSRAVYVAVSDGIYRENLGKQGYIVRYDIKTGQTTQLGPFRYPPSAIALTPPQ